MNGWLQRLWASLGFRMASYYAVLVALTLLVALAIVYVQTVGVMFQRVTRHVQVVAQNFEELYRSAGAQAVAAEIRRNLADDLNTEGEIYLLLDASGRPLAGNLDPDGAPAPASTESVREVRRAGRMVRAYLVGRDLPDGSRLVVGQDLRDQENLESLVLRACAATSVVAAVLLVGGTLIVRGELDRSVARLRRIAAQVGAGDLRPRLDASGPADEFGLLHRDVNQMLDRMQTLMDGVRHVSDAIAHNLRTPLTRVMLRLRQAESGALPPAQCQAVMADTLRDLEDLTQTLERLLQIAEAEAGARRRSFEPVALDQVADDTIEFYDAVAEATGARLQRLPAEPVRVLGDRALLASALANLVDNALKYGATHVRVGTARVGDRVQLIVEDDGPGIPAAERERIGTRFHRLNRELPGHGLGLASVRAVVGLHGGRLRFEDAAPGLRVAVELPAAAAPEA